MGYKKVIPKKLRKPKKAWRAANAAVVENPQPKSDYDFKGGQ
jgi:hypothetical protein